MTDENWGLRVGEEARKSFSRWLKDGFIDRYLSGDHILDIGYKGYLDDVVPIVPRATGVDLDYPGYDGTTLPFPDASQDAVFVSHTLEHISDYRSSIAEWFRVLRPGGHLILAVPHQFLYERNLSLPSRFNADHKRFYTPASLLMEVEEALDPCSYRVRLLEDNDADFDYSIPPQDHAGGCYEILLVLEKIPRPKWADDLAPEGPEERGEGVFTVEPRPREGEPVMAITGGLPDTRSILLMKLDHRGDFILAERPLRRLRSSFPDAAITLICGPWNTAAAGELGFFDEVVPFSIFAENATMNAAVSLTERVRQFRQLFTGRSFDLAIDLRVESDTRLLLNEVSATTKAGFGFPGVDRHLDIALPLSSPTASGKAKRGIFECSAFSTRYGKHHGFAIALPRLSTVPAGETIIWGPYQSVTPGAYRMQLLLESEAGPFQLGFDVCHNSGNNIIYADALTPETAAAGFALQVTETIRDLEIRVRAGNTPIPPLRFHGCTYQKEGGVGGPHQTELMMLLVTCIEERMRYPAGVRSVSP